MTTYLPYLANIIAVSTLVFAIYLPRHHRRDLAVAYLGVNVAVMAVTAALGASTIAAGLGLGLFGVLSIIRLRSDELAQHEVAYYFSALALGLLGGLGSAITGFGGWMTPILMLLIVGVLAIADTEAFRSQSRRELVVLDQAITNDSHLHNVLADRLDAQILGVNVMKVDFVTDTTTVEVRFAPLATAKRVEVKLAR